MAIKNVTDEAIKQARLNMKTAYQAYKQTIRERDNLVAARLEQGWTVRYVAAQFGITDSKVNDIRANDLRAKLTQSAKPIHR